MKPNYIILYIIVSACAFFGLNAEWGYMAGSPWWSHLTFHFAHGNIFHLAANLLVAFLLLLNRKDPWWLWPVCYAVATLCSFCIATDKPTVGLSGILFVYYGIILTKDNWKWKSILYLCAYNMIACLFGNQIAWLMHFACLTIGAAIGGVMLWLYNIERKEKMYG